MTDDRHERWYLKLMGPSKKGWVDPSSMYLNARAFNTLLDDLTEPFSPDEIDLVAGVEPHGFILGAGIAARLGKGILTIRMGGRFSGPTDAVDFVNAKAGTVDKMETRKPAFLPGTRVLVTDQWVESGGAMRSALELIKRQGGVVAGIATLCINEVNGNERLREDYKCATAVVPGTDFQRQCNAKRLATSASFDWNTILPEIAGRS